MQATKTTPTPGNGSDTSSAAAPRRPRRPARPTGDCPNIYELVAYLEQCLVLARDAFQRVEESLKRERAYRAKQDDRLRLIEQRLQRVEVGDLAKTIQGMQDGSVTPAGDDTPF